MEHHIQFMQDDMRLVLLDQRLLPASESFYSCTTVEDVIYSLKEMVVRGAPAIGVTAAWGCVIAAHEVQDAVNWETQLLEKLQDLANARPTAVNLVWAVERMRFLLQRERPKSVKNLLTTWIQEARKIHQDDIAINKKMGEYGSPVIEDGDTIMTHCNAGALATAGFGTALGVIYAAWRSGKRISVIANETRPFLQGARLTAYELQVAGVPVTIACDNACAFLMQRGMVQKVVVGADRIAANGDAANKIGTYGVALLAKAHGIPFYVAAPLSTIDRNTMTGADIPIEERIPREVTHIGQAQITPEGVPVFNYAFDVTPADCITGIITEQGILTAPYAKSIQDAFAIVANG